MAGMRKGIDWPTLAGLAALLLWSVSVGMSRGLSEKLGAVGSGAVVYALSGVLALGFSLVARRRQTLEAIRELTPRYALGCGGFFVLYCLSFYLAIGLARDRAQAIELSLLNYIWPGLTILLSMVLLPMRVSWPVFPGIAVSLAGVFLAMTAGGKMTWETFAANVADNPIAYAGGLTAGVTWALYSVLTRRWGSPSGGAVPLFLLMTGLVLGLLIPAFPPAPFTLTRAAVVEALGLSLVTAVAYTLWDVSMRRGKVVRVAAVSNFTPLLSVLFSCAYLRVAPEPRVWLGGALIVAGSLACSRSIREIAR